jgi:hypothetical protein
VYVQPDEVGKFCDPILAGRVFVAQPGLEYRRPDRQLILICKNMIVAQDIMLAVFRDDGTERRGHKVTVLRLTADRATGSHWPHVSSLGRLEHNKTACLDDIGSNLAYTLGKKEIFWDDLLVDFAFNVKTNGVIAGRFSFDKLVSDADSDNVVFRIR